MDFYSALLAKANGGGGGGGGSSVMELHMDENMTLDKTWQEITSAPFAVLKTTTEIPDQYLVLPLGNYSHAGGNYIVEFFNAESRSLIPFVTESADGYPVYSDE